MQGMCPRCDHPVKSPLRYLTNEVKPQLVTTTFKSLESRSRDRGDKFYEYEQAGVKEYWLIDPNRKHVEFYQRGEDGIFRLVSVEDGVFSSEVSRGF